MSLTKLTLSVEPEIVRKAKRSAAMNHMSVSSMFTRYVRAVSGVEAADLRGSPVTQRASGLAKLSARTTDADLVADALSAKYQPGQ